PHYYIFTYTLSLHDALPIFFSYCTVCWTERKWPGSARAVNRFRDYASGNFSSARTYSWRRSFYKPNSHLVQFNKIGRVDAIQPLDRKSTRLNSSHQIISYAV